MSLESVALVCKEVGIYTGAMTILWKVFVFLKAATDAVRSTADTARAIPGFMNSTTAGLGDMRVYMRKAVDNHLNHIESGIVELSNSSSKMADGMEKLQSDFRDYMLEDAKTQAIVLERLPQL
jgi:hypothetical protein